MYKVIYKYNFDKVTYIIYICDHSLKINLNYDIIFYVKIIVKSTNNLRKEKINGC